MENREQLALTSLGEKQMRAQTVPEELRALEARREQCASELERIRMQSRAQEDALASLRARARAACDARTDADELLACQLRAIDAEAALLRFLSGEKQLLPSS